MLEIGQQIFTTVLAGLAQRCDNSCITTSRFPDAEKLNSAMSYDGARLDERRCFEQPIHDESR